MKIDEWEKLQELDRIKARLARHETVTRITLTMIVILAGLALALLAQHLLTTNHPITP
jgi:hypothetical protein